MFKFWHDNGGRDAMIEAFGALWEKLSAVGKEIKNIVSTPFEASFGKFDGARLIKITESVRDFIKSLAPSEELKRLFQTTIFTVFQLLRNGVNIVQRAATFVGMLWKAIEPGRTLLYQIVRDGEEVIVMISQIIDKIGESFSNNGGLQALANGLANLFNGVMQVIKPVSDAVYKFFENVLESPFAQKAGEFLANIAKSFEELTAAIDFGAIAEKVTNFLNGFWEILTKIGGYVAPVASAIWDFVSSIFGIGKGAEDADGKLTGIKDKIDGIGKVLGDIKGNIIQWFLDHAPDEMIEDVSTALKKLDGFLQPIRDKVSGIKDSLKDGTWYSKLKDWIGGVVEKIGELKDAIKDFVGDSAVKAFTSAWEFIANAFNKFVNVLKKGWSFVKMVFQSLFGDSLYSAVTRIFEFLNKLAGVKALFTLTDILDNVSELAEGLSKLKTNLEKASINLTKSFLAPMKSFATKQKSEAIRNIAISIAILAGSLIALSFVEFDKIQNGIIAVGELMGMLIGFYIVLEKINKKNNIAQGGKGLLGMLFGGSNKSALSSNAMSFVMLAGSILMISFALRNLADIPFMDIQKGILAIAEIMVELSLFSRYMKDIKTGAVDITAVSMAVDLLSLAVSKIGSLDFESWLKGIGGLGLVMIELTAFLHDMEGVSVKGFAGIITLAAGIRVLVMSVRALGGMDLAGLAKGLGGVAVMMIELYFFTKKMEDIDTKGFAGVIVLALGLRVLVSSVRALGSLDFESLLKGLGGVAVLLIELSWFMHDMEKIDGISIATAASLIVLAFALKTLTKAVKTLGDMSLGDMIQGLLGVAGVLGILLVACKLMEEASPKMLLGGAAMIVLGAAVWVLVPPIMALAAIPLEKLAGALIIIAGAFTVLGVAGLLIGKIGADMLIASVGLIAMSAAVWVLVPPLIALSAVPFENVMKALIGLASTFIIFGAAGAILGPLAFEMILAAGGILALAAAAAAAGAAMLVIAAGLTAMSNAILVVMDTILALLQSILGGLPFIGDDIDEWFSERRKSLKNEMDPADSKKTGSDWVKGIGDGISQQKGGVEGALGSVTDSMKNVATEAKQSGEDTGGNFLSGLGLSDIKGVVTGDTDQLGETIKNMMTENGLDAGEMLGDGVLEGFGSTDLKGTLSGEMSDMGLDVEDMMGEYGFNAGNKWAASVSEGVENGAPGIHLTVGNETRFLSSELLEHYKEIGFITGKEYDAAIASEIENGGAEIVLSTELALTRLEGIDITHPGETVGDTFLEGIRSKSSKVGETVTEDFGKEAESGLKETKQYFTDGGEDSAEAFAMSLMDQTMGVKDAGEDVGESAVNGLEESEGEAADTGEDYGYGFGKGMSSTTSYVKSEARALAAEALRSMAQELDINSPSKETRRFGKFGGMGLALGFKDMGSQVKTQAGALADKGLTAMQSAMENLRELLDFDTDIDPTIRPVMDLQQIQNGMNTIGSMFGNQKFAMAGAFGMDPYAFASIRNVTSAADRSPIGDQSVVNAIGGLQEEISTLKSAMEQMKFEADGREIGHVAYREVDRRLGNTVARNRREGRG